MNRATDILETIATRKSTGEPFALATVVCTVATTSAKAGAKAVILPDGTFSEGWIGGGCARAAVLKAAKDALADRKSRLVSVAGGGFNRTRSHGRRGRARHYARRDRDLHPRRYGAENRAAPMLAFDGNCP